MAEAFKFELVSPERLLVSEDVVSVVIPSTEGEITVMANHAPVMTTVKPGVVTVTTAAGKTDRYVVFGGFADILPEGCTLLAESATHADKIRREEITRRVEETRKGLSEATEHHDRTRLEEYLGQLTTLEGAILPA